jgi:DNA invertase Pin-like site-specific DNA recombinase
VASSRDHRDNCCNIAISKLSIEFISFREAIDTSGALGRALIVIVGAIAELERNLIIERVRAGMRQARLEGRHVGRKPLDLDREVILRDRGRGQSLGELARTYRASRTTIRRVLNGVPKGPSQSSPQTQQNRRPETAA